MCFSKYLKGLRFPAQGISCHVDDPVLFLPARSLIHFYWFAIDVAKLDICPHITIHWV